MLITALNTMWGIMSSFFSFIYDALFTPLSDLMIVSDNAFIQFLLSIADFTGLETFLSTYSLAGLIFSVGTVAILIIYFFIP